MTNNLVNKESLEGIKGTVITHLNIRSMFLHYDLISYYLDPIKPMIASFSETWLNALIPTRLIPFPGYNVYRQDREFDADCTKGGGLCTLVKSDIPCDYLKLAHLNRNDHDIEIQWLIVKPPHMKTMIIGNMYRPPEGKTELFFEYLTYALSEIEHLPDWEIHMLGDVNVNALIRSKPLTDLSNLTKQAGLMQFISVCVCVCSKSFYWAGVP